VVYDLRLRLFLLWVRITRPRVYGRLMRLWRYRLLEAICNLYPPLWMLPKRSPQSLMDEWKCDPLPIYG
jgi:hypothetical protein